MCKHVGLLPSLPECWGRRPGSPCQRHVPEGFRQGARWHVAVHCCSNAARGAILRKVSKVTVVGMKGGGREERVCLGRRKITLCRCESRKCRFQSGPGRCLCRHAGEKVLRALDAMPGCGEGLVEAQGAGGHSFPCINIFGCIFMHRDDESKFLGL